MLAKNMGTSIAMLERHYSHLEVIHKAELLAGRAEGSKKTSKAHTKNTEIMLVDGNLEDLLFKEEEYLDQNLGSGGIDTRKS
ncbi:MAG TPA: hypothetical protein PKD37_07140 [Oligoflexia bacterium]|nr:hypothetical protein [Oligoflexia bacterium]HMP27738.1 hypothetical protein [Oligoflexia bacterium]